MWLSDGWAARRHELGRPAVLAEPGRRHLVSITLAGKRPMQPGGTGLPPQLLRGRRVTPAGPGRLPTEAEWEIAAAGPLGPGHFLESGRFHPAAARPTKRAALQAVRRRLAMDGQSLLSATPATGRGRAPWASTTASSCATNWCCAAPRAPRRAVMPAHLPQLLPAGRPLAVHRFSSGPIGRACSDQSLRRARETALLSASTNRTVSVLPFRGVIDADSLGRHNPCPVMRIVEQEEFRAGQIESVVGARDLGRAGELARTGQIRLPTAQRFGERECSASAGPPAVLATMLSMSYIP